jgi:WD40 repeat protein
MSDKALTLTADQRRRLLDALELMALCDTSQGRSLLLGDLPANLVSSIPRSETKTIDLSNIVDLTDRWGMIDGEKPALLVVLENARREMENSDVGRKLDALYREITATPSLPLTPASVLKSRVEQYLKFKEAIEAGSWQQALQLAQGIETYNDVPELVTRARAGIEVQEQRAAEVKARIDQLMQLVADAYAEHNWLQVIKRAQQLGVNTPAEFEDWISEAWTEVLKNAHEHSINGHRNQVRALLVSQDSQYVISASTDTLLKLWGLDTGEEIKTFSGHRREVYAAAISPDGQMGLSGSNDNSAKLWDLSNGNELRTLSGHTNGVYAIAFTPDGQQAVSGSDDTTLRLWDLTSAKQVRLFEGHKGPIYSVAVTPDGKYVISGSRDKTLILWDLASGEIRHILKGHRTPVSTLALTPDGQMAVSGSYDGEVRVWHLASGENLRTFQTEATIWDLTITPNSLYAVVGSEVNTLSIWDITSGRLLRAFPDRTNIVSAVAVTPDGRAIIAGEWSGTIRIWTVPSTLLT